MHDLPPNVCDKQHDLVTNYMGTYSQASTHMASACTGHGIKERNDLDRCLLALAGTFRCQYSSSKPVNLFDGLNKYSVMKRVVTFVTRLYAEEAAAAIYTVYTQYSGGSTTRTYIWLMAAWLGRGHYRQNTRTERSMLTERSASKRIDW
jgi:hypothetical protein